MGVPGLWKELEPAGKVRSLTEVAVVEGFENNSNGLRGFRIGIDASIWFFHAAYGKEGENPELRTMFFRCATLMHAPFLPLFVFDGPLRPGQKRGKSINRQSHKLTTGMKEIVESFGYEWRVAPGEAEAELAYLNRIGVIDGILSDDVDNFLFGATTVIRNSSNNLSGNRSNPVLNSDGRDDKNHSRVFRIEDITDKTGLTRGDMILIGLCSGGDYDTSGMTGCGPGIARGLVKYGFGRSLYDAAKNLSRENLPAFLANWRNQMRHELATDSQGFLGSKRKKLASQIPDAFPDIDILLSYVNPLTSESMGRASDNLDLTWRKEPDLGKLAATCEFYFEWGYRDAIVKRFKTVIWHGAVMRILRRAVLDLEEKRLAAPTTPRKNAKPPVEGTPSKLITRHFSSMNIDSDDSDADDDEQLMSKITRARNHASTDGILEYRVEVRPGQLVRLAESGIKNTRRPLDVDPWAGMTESGNEADADDVDVITPEQRRAQEQKEILLWIPASMMQLAEPRLVREFEDKEEAKRAKKAKKGTGTRSAAPKARSPKAKRIVKKAKPVVEEDTEEEVPRIVIKKQVKAIPEEEEESGPSTPSKPKTAPKAKMTLPSDSEDSEDDQLPVFSKPMPAKKIIKTGDDPFLQSAPLRVVRDLTRGKSQARMNDFMPLAHARARSKATASAPVRSLSAVLGVSNRLDAVSAPRTSGSSDPTSQPSVPAKTARLFPLAGQDRSRARQRSNSSDSDSRLSTKVLKSPRKAKEHTSPRKGPTASRAASPTPGARRPLVKPAVIDISSDSEDEPRPRLPAKEIIDLSDL
ncbi:unnamed protein product [Mycena citricolor]|uniref:XPG-I domain-containing protein n=1 Tax=Mycena citricolor TaxID=2018698 RepID=A0AAD2GVC7_9AGAR|nr:unnamed protein product [Mycena citricolor]